MGAKDSKRACLSYEDAVKRISDVELKRICEVFKRLSGGSQFMTQSAFVQHVLGDGVPYSVAGWLYNACGGTTRGIALRELVCGLVLLTKGTREEKIRFLWSLYCTDSGTHICRSEFQRAVHLESSGTSGPGEYVPILSNDCSLFVAGHERATFDEFKAWLDHNSSGTILSHWLLAEPSVSLASGDHDTPTFYQTLAGVTHLEETDICELEKSFWILQASAVSGQLDLACVSALISPPVPASACPGLFHALDVNHDGHVDFKELCCGISAACRGPVAERVKFCFKMFDQDRDGRLNYQELRHMLEVLTFISRDHLGTSQQDQSIIEEDINNALKSLQPHITVASENLEQHLGQEEFAIWGTPSSSLVHPTLELLFQVCHVSLGLRPRCRHHEREIVLGWLEREERRGYRVGQFWYLISSEWWKTWISYTSKAEMTNHCSGCGQKLSVSIQNDRSVEEGIACDESFTSNSSESMGDLLRGANSLQMETKNSNGTIGDTCSIASSSGVSSSSGNGSSIVNKKSASVIPPGPINNQNLVAESPWKVQTLTGEGGRLRKDRTLVQHRDFILVPDSLWKALAHWYGGPLPLPRQVIKPPNSDEVDLELYPLNLRILRHQPQSNSSGTSGTGSHTVSLPHNSWGSVVGGYGAAALSTAGLAAPPLLAPRRYLAHTAAFSRLATIGQVLEFLSQRLSLRSDDLRLWHLAENSHHNSSTTPSLLILDDDQTTLQELGLRDGDQLLLEVRNADLTWPEELGALVAGARQQDRVQGILPVGATGLHNLGNTCFMNAALQAVSNTRPLTMYFKRDVRLCELNQNNPLGTRGQVARRYAELCRELWTGTARSIAPLKLRWCVARHAPHFGGGGQHDSQELLAWLLDALHEDLNRVTGKRYTELSDSGGRPDAVVASEAWKQHLARDHSIITDLFYGQLKSKVTCQTCGHESVRFDAFNVLSLPLPMDSYTLCEVLLVRLDGSVPVKYGIRLPSEARYQDLKECLGRLSGVPIHQIVLVEVSEAQIRNVLNDIRRVNQNIALELVAYEVSARVIQDSPSAVISNSNNVVTSSEAATSPSGSPKLAARSPETTIRRSIDQPLNVMTIRQLQNGLELPRQIPIYITAVHRKCVRQDTYFVAQQRTRFVLFGWPLLLSCGAHLTTQRLYEVVWTQVTRLLSPVPQSDQTNHATDCDDSLGYEFPFTLRTVTSGGQMCAICPWTKFCRGCALSCSAQELVTDVYKATVPSNMIYIAIDWDPTALHLRYQSTRERNWIEHESVAICRKQHTEPVDLDHCLKAFTSEESLETMYHCSKCHEKQPATKKLQIWRLPPILIIHLKRFDYVNGKWVKTHKVVNFPFKDFDPTSYLASVPQETILRHKQLCLNNKLNSTTKISENDDSPTLNDKSVLCNNISDDKNSLNKSDINKFKTENTIKENFDECKPRVRRDRLESTSLLRTPVLDENLEDFHMHHLQDGQNPFELKYHLYAVVSHSGMLNGGHYVSYACNPNGNWYCYNDSSCREVRITDGGIAPLMDTSSAYILFYEREGLDYSPYLPDVPLGQQPIEAELEEGESELRKQFCVIC